MQSGFSQQSEPNFGVRRLALDQAAAALEPTIYPASKSGDELSTNKGYVTIDVTKH